MSSLPPLTWQRLQSTREETLNRADRARTLSAEIGGDMADKEEQPDPMVTTFHDRYQLFEKTVSALFRTDHPCCVVSDPEFTSLGLSDHDFNATNDETPKQAAAAVRVEDDDYDFDDEEDEPPPKKPTPPLLEHSSFSGQSTESPAKEAKAIVVTREKLEADRKAAEEAAKRAFHTTFFTLETDRDAMLEQQKLDESDRQVNAEANAAQEAQPGKLSSANLGASSLTLKHLIARIDATRERVKISDMELRNLMSEVRKNRSKWASEDKIGQEELYEAAEKVVLELRAMTEHSTAFLNRVNKREAPDYYQIIKQPMDLGTVMKKLKQHQYKSKTEFVDDLNLIWSNCLKYNADPSHFLRKHAKAMQKQTAKLEPLIPDIVIRDRAEVEAEEAGAAEVDAEGESDDEPIMSTRGRKGPGTKKSRKGAPQPREGTPDPKPPIVNLIRADSNPPANESQVGLNNGFLTPTGGTPVPNGVSGSISQMELDHDKVVDDDKDPEYQAWKKITKKGRAKVASERHKLLRGTKLNPEEPALIRSRIGMARHIKGIERHLKSIEDDEGIDGVGLINGDADEDDGILLPDYYYPQSCVPEIPWRTIWANDEGEVEMPDERLRLAPRGMFVQPKSELSKRIDSNIKQMQETRKVCSKIAVIKQMQVQTQMYANQFTKYDPKPFVEKDADDFVISENVPAMCANVARATLQRSIGKIFYHAGFEEFQPTAIDAVTDIAMDYFQKLGKTLMVYKEAPQHERRFENEEIILHTLYENGADVESLDNYIRDDVERLGTRLHSIHERMRSHLADLLRPALADSGGDDTNFVDGSEQFVGGDFAADIGDDFFGFKELGLDKEFSLSSLSVPLHLLQGRMHNAYQPANAISNVTAAEGHKQPPAFEPITRDLIRCQIGIVQKFFLDKLPANNDEPLIEDEDLPVKQRPPKPRLPPTGKISLPRKRPLHGQGGGSKKKKKPNVTPPSRAASENVKKESVSMERSISKISEAGDDGNGGMMSPESLAA